MYESSGKDGKNFNVLESEKKKEKNLQRESTEALKEELCEWLKVVPEGTKSDVHVKPKVAEKTTSVQQAVRGARQPCLREVSS